MNDKILFAPGQKVFGQGEPGETAFLLESGKVAIHQHIDGRQLELDSVSPGEIFGEMAILGGGKRMATAVATEECVVAPLASTVFERKLEAADRFLRALVIMVIKNIQTSHRVFLRRPRSFRDHVRQMRSLCDNVRRFSTRLDDTALVDDLAAALGKLDGALRELDRLALRCPDQRHDIILDEQETEGVGLDDVVGSESRRRVYAPPRAD